MKRSLLGDKSIEKFVAKRVLILLPVLIILGIVFFSGKKYIVLGLIVGAFSGLLKFSVSAKAYRTILNPVVTRLETIIMISVFFASLFGTAAIMVFSIMKDLMLFAGVATGILLVPFFITFNSLTEGFGITHNNFE